MLAVNRRDGRRLRSRTWAMQRPRNERSIQPGRCVRALLVGRLQTDRLTAEKVGNLQLCPFLAKLMNPLGETERTIMSSAIPAYAGVPASLEVRARHVLQAAFAARPREPALVVVRTKQVERALLLDQRSLPVSWRSLSVIRSRPRGSSGSTRCGTRRDTGFTMCPIVGSIDAAEATSMVEQWKHQED